MQKLQLTCKSSSGKLVDIDVFGAAAGEQPLESIALPMHMNSYIDVSMAQSLLSAMVAKVEDDGNLQHFLTDPTFSGALVFDWAFRCDAVFDRPSQSHLSFVESVHFVDADELAVFQPSISHIVSWTHLKPKNARTTLWYSLPRQQFTIVTSCDGLQWTITFNKEPS